MSKTRRDFLKLSSSVTLVTIGAFSFGCSLEPLVQDKDKKVALVYATRYGATKDTAEWIANGINRDIDLLNIEDISFSKTVKEYDLFILGSGVWIDGVHKDMLKFLKEYKAELKDKIVASFILCGTTGKDLKGDERIEQYFTKFHASLDKKPLLNEKFGGRIIIDKLNEKDKKLLDTFYKRVLKREFVSWDRTEPKKAELFGKKILDA
ncbi:MAG: flavodoxin domain-containing protein [Campylobacterota bacterium]|nr:flavodoxin domain-containing protein [Campylobacterota bacterium]